MEVIKSIKAESYFAPSDAVRNLKSPLGGVNPPYRTTSAFQVSKSRCSVISVITLLKIACDVHRVGLNGNPRNSWFQFTLGTFSEMCRFEAPRSMI